MTSNTQLLTAPATFYINENMNIIQFSIVGLGSDSAFNYTGNSPLNDTDGNPLTPTAIPISGQGVYNSKNSGGGANSWNNIIIEVTAGSVGLELMQN